MAEWHQLNQTQKAHATTFSDILDNLTKVEEIIFDSIKDDYNKAKAWLENHPKARNSAAIFTGLTSLYIMKRYKMGK